MNQSPFNKKNLIIFFLSSYLTFWLLICIVGLAMYVFKAPEPIVMALKNLCAWSPNLALLVLFKKLMPDLSLKAFLKRELLTRIGLSRTITILLLQTGLFLVTIVLISFFVPTATPVFKQITISSFSLFVLLTLTAGATGEELGWRGYAYNELRKRYDMTETAIILGLVWTFWHHPQWVMSSMTGIVLVKYILTFMACVLPFSVIISFFYERTGSLRAPILIHFLMNFFAQGFFQIDTYTIFLWTAPPYICAALILIIIDKRKKYKVVK